MIEQVKNHIKPKRYKHTLGVMKLAVRLAEYYGEDIIEAELAALLHDYSKYESDKVILAYMASLGPLHPVIKHKANLAHGYHSAKMAKDLFKVDNEAVLNAIRRHTFGHPEMTQLDKIIYLADSLEENRNFDGIEPIREALFTNLDQALLLSIESTLRFELSKGNMIHEDTIKLRNKLLEALWTY